MGKKTLVSVAMIAVVVLAVVGLWLVYSSNNRSPEPAPAADTPTESSQNDSDTTQQPAEEPAQIAYTDDGFKPASLTVQKGQEIRIINQSSSPLEFSSDDHPTHRDNADLNTQTIQPGEETTITISDAGTWGFHNHLDAGHMGEVIVRE